MAVRATDPLVQVGVTGELSKAAGLLLVDDEADADVVVAVAESGLRTMLSAPTRLVLVADEPREGELWAALEYGLVVLIPRAEATPQRLLRAIADAHHERGHLPADQLGDLLRGLSRLHENTLAPRDLTLSVLSRRETEVVRLLSEGLGTAEIATKLNYSERTVKNILHDLQARLGLRNRAHAVAHALRQGLI
ncbi:helix-turn-helix transcriptional regulator [Amycolatopsis pithecellobii]|uniref:helix-turn-helix transcriptional regulator n=1 Tax=Amycolatopsis pithecellobii TaxID=664692 RepID=UPI0028AE3006|nr:LuxR C-terminal-related transcriptional regulator [Amycolatopsis pithecellobii]